MEGKGGGSAWEVITREIVAVINSLHSEKYEAKDLKPRVSLHNARTKLQVTTWSEM